MDLIPHFGPNVHTSLSPFLSRPVTPVKPATGASSGARADVAKVHHRTKGRRSPGRAVLLLRFVLAAE